MHKPRDFLVTSRIGGVRLARNFSNVVSPPIIFAALGLALAWVERDFWEGFFWAAVFGFFISLAPGLVVIYLLKSGRISDIHMNTPRERRLPYLSSVAGAAGAVIVFSLFDGPELLRCLALLSAMTSVALALINMVWLISIHAASIAAAALITGLVFGWLPGLLVSPLVGLVCWARLFLRRHTPAQIVAGLALGIGAVLTLTLTGCF